MRAHGVFAQMLRHFENEAVAEVVGLQRVQDLPAVRLVERHVDNGADDLATRRRTGLDEQSAGARL